MPAPTLICPDTNVTIPAWQCPETGKKFPTGLIASPQQRLLDAMNSVPFVASAAPPETYGFFPQQRDAFGNDRYGDCVTAEEMFTKTCTNPEIDIKQLSSVGIAWARSHGVLNGADLGSVADWMREKGFQIGPQLYNDGPRLSVDYTNDTVLKAAIYQCGPVKIAIQASALPGGAGSRDGFWKVSGRAGGSDHCVALNAYGTAEYIFDQLKIPLPSGLPAQTFGYALYTWATIGFVGPDWVKGVLDEAMARSPTTVGVPPLAPPTPPPGPGPGPTPGPLPQTITLPAIAAGEYILVPKVHI